MQTCEKKQTGADTSDESSGHSDSSDDAVSAESNDHSDPWIISTDDAVVSAESSDHSDSSDHHHDAESSGSDVELMEDESEANSTAEE